MTSISDIGAALVTLREAIPQDYDFLISVYDSTRDDLDVVEWDPSQRRALIEMQFQAQNAQYDHAYPQASKQIILVDGNPVGRIIIDRSRNEITLVDVALLPDHRNRGLGTRLIEGLIDEALGAGKAVRLHVLSGSPAVKLYQRLGFSITDDDGTYLEMKHLPRETPPCNSSN